MENETIKVITHNSRGLRNITKRLTVFEYMKKANSCTEGENTVERKLDKRK